MLLPTLYRLTSEDIPLMRALNTLFGREFNEPDTYGAEPPDDAYLHNFLAKDHVFALVALADGEVVGGLVAYELEKFERARSEVYIYDLAVAETHRRQGIATALIKHLCKIVANSNAWVVFVQADYGDTPAIELYKSLGTQEEVLHFDIAVHTQPNP